MRRPLPTRPLALGLLCLAAPVAAQADATPEAARAYASAPPLGSIAHALGDSDGDRVPDRAGTEVTVSGRATITDGALGIRRATSLVDGTGAVWLRGLSGPRVNAGDSLVVRGKLTFESGLSIIEEPEIRRVAAGPAPSPVSKAVDSGDLEEWEGRFVTVEGAVASVNRVGSGGRAMTLALDDRSVVTVFIFGGHPESFDLTSYAAGDRLRVSGLAGQFDRSPPYDASYQVYPLTPSDIVRGGIPSVAYRWGALLALALMAIASLWGASLRAQVHKHTAALRRSEAHYRALVSSASDAVFVHRLDGTGVEVNPAARRAFGLAPEAPPPSLLEVIAPEHRDRAEAHLVVVGADGNARCDLAVRPLARGRRKSDAAGHSRTFEFESQRVEVDGETRVLSLARDVAARRAYEAELEAARCEAEEMARLKSAFLASMSHEIRTPLTAVIGYADILAEEVPPEQRELVEIIERGGRRLLDTLNSVLDLARLDSGAATLAPRPMDLADHVRRSVDLVRSLADAKGLALDFECDPEPVPAAADANALDRIVTNLVGNAIKFTERGGVTVRLRTDGPEAVIEVEDTGIGIDARFLPDLFSEFRQESEGTARSHEGSGLGLAITQRLAVAMGGSVSVTSEKGVGSTFTVRFPRAPEDAHARAFAPEAALTPVLAHA